MSAELMPIIAFLSGAMAAAVLSSLSVSRGSKLQQEILKRGQVAPGRVLHVWRPKLYGAFTRIYFEFEPAGIDDTVRGCHIDRRSLAEPSASLPAVGTTVSVRYLPESPRQAVIARLVSRFTD
ncbi:DUF3592 domain-containing protein [Steroidobacter sp.]|uniref:DUF3592 domain-containing protein n=1 Tax=Steroidobacter sp. TaxID=1978227 RepID=UPI001A57871D|nr:DUF3592 domain-containing protein [Steroidobacter sp.]MBL8264742.1 hypothetical protein [Steroidobacter sp.]